jgi:circadian clock protein KaiB
MVKRKTMSTIQDLETATAEPDKRKYVLRFYVAGITPRSRKAIANVKELCDEHLPGRCELEIIDIYQQPKLAAGEQIIAVPTLIKKLPLPLRKLIGDMSHVDKFLVGLDLKSKKNHLEK